MGEGFERTLLDVVLRDDGFVVAVYDKVMLQVRRRSLQVADLAAIECAAAKVVAGIGDEAVGFLGILEAGAEPPEDSVREAQRKTMGRFIRDPRVNMSAVLLGAGPRATVHRTMLRLLGVGQPRMRIAAEIDQAADWIVERGVRVSPIELTQVAEHLRGMRGLG